MLNESSGCVSKSAHVSDSDVELVAGRRELSAAHRVGPDVVVGRVVEHCIRAHRHLMQLTAAYHATAAGDRDNCAESKARAPSERGATKI